MGLLAQRSSVLAASNPTAVRSPVLEFQLELPAEQPRPTQWPKITLVTAVYNGEAFLDATIRSILNQGYPNLEYVVVDDGCSDLTPDIIRAYSPYLNRCIHQPNQGLFAALNAGFAASTGEIMGWLNSSNFSRSTRSSPLRLFSRIYPR
jgi:glycosyltransferase involved in cell wall biosynthesis